MVAWADQLRDEKGENLGGMSDVNWYLLAGVVTPTETVTTAPTESGKLVGVISTWLLVRWSMGAALTTAFWTLVVLAVLNVAARAPTLTA
jgi:hypothetical protein